MKNPLQIILLKQYLSYQLHILQSNEAFIWLRSGLEVGCKSIKVLHSSEPMIWWWTWPWDQVIIKSSFQMIDISSADLLFQNIKINCWIDVKHQLIFVDDNHVWVVDYYTISGARNRSKCGIHELWSIEVTMGVKYEVDVSIHMGTSMGVGVGVHVGLHQNTSMASGEEARITARGWEWGVQIQALQQNQILIILLHNFIIFSQY